MMFICRGALSAIALLLTMAMEAFAADIAVCGGSDGQGYYPSVGLTAGHKSEWTPDSISKGRITLSFTAPNNFGVLISDATGAIFSSTADGTKVARVGQTESSITMLVVYPMLVETYTFLISSTGFEVMWTTNKYTTPILKVGAYRASCTFVVPPK